MNGYEFKREIERIFKVARNMCPNVTDEMLYTNGAIHYMNGNDSTPFDWNCNNRLCEFLIFHKNEMGFSCQLQQFQSASESQKSLSAIRRSSQYPFHSHLKTV